MPCHCARMFPFNQMKLFILSCLFTALACFDQSLNYRKQTDGKHQTNVKQEYELKWQKLNNSLAKEGKKLWQIFSVHKVKPCKAEEGRQQGR